MSSDSEVSTSTPISKLIVISKKRELTSPEFPIDLKKNKVLELSTDSSDISCSDLDTDSVKIMADTSILEGATGNTLDENSAQSTQVQPSEMPHITIGEAQIQAISALLKDSFKLDMKESFKDELPDMVESIIRGVVDGLNAKIGILETDVQSLKRENNELKTKMVNLERAVDAGEQYSRRNSLRMSGVQEQPNEDTDAIVIETARAIDSEINLSDIDRSHRVGKPRVGRPRDIIIKFSTYRARQKFYKKRTVLKDKGYRGVFLNEDLTKMRMDLLYKARVRVKSLCLKGAWSSDGTILVKDNSDNIHRITSEADLIGFNAPRELPPSFEPMA